MQDKTISVSRKPSSRPASPEPRLLDIRPIFAAGASPCGIIDQAVADLEPGQSLVLLAPFEPIPLFTKLVAHGLQHTSEPLPDGSWRIVFNPTGTVQAGAAKHQSCCCSE